VTVLRLRKAPSYLIDYIDGTRFVIDEHHHIIWCDWAAPFTTEDAVTYLVGPVLSFVLRLRGVLALHASAVVVDDAAVLLLGGAGAGKSTLAAAMARQGHAVVSDDVAAISWRYGRPWVRPGYPRLRLWPDSGAKLYGPSTDLPALTPNWDKRYVDLIAAERFQAEQTVIRAIFALGPRVPGEASWRQMEGHEAAMSIIAQTSMTTYLDADMRVRELAQVTRVLDHVRVYEVQPSDGIEALEELSATIVALARERSAHR
jgi:chloramphenicol 3-O-phosphotransferase